MRDFPVVMLHSSCAECNQLSAFRELSTYHSGPSTAPQPFHRNAFEAAQIHFPCSQHGQGVHFDKVSARRNEEVRQSIGGEFRQHLGDTRIVQNMQHDELLTPTLFGNTSD